MLEKTGRRILKVGDFDQTGELAALTAKNPTLSGPSEATTILTQGGIEATRVIHERSPKMKVLILTLYCSSENCLRAMQSGASGYLLKDSVDDEVVDAIRSIAKGGLYFGAGVTIPPESFGVPAS